MRYKYDKDAQGCKFSYSEVNPVQGFLLHTTCNSLVSLVSSLIVYLSTKAKYKYQVILKSIFNSVIFALRQNQVIISNC